MAARLLRLRLALLAGRLRTGPRAGSVAGALLLAGVVLAVWWGAWSLRDAPTATAHVVTVLAGAAVTAACLLAPVLTGGDDQLDPRRFAPFGVTAPPLAAGLLAAGVVSPPILALALTTASVVALWADGSTPPLAVIGGPLLGFVCCYLIARVMTALASWLLPSRRPRELVGLLVLLVVVVLVPVGVFLVSQRGAGAASAELAGAAVVLGYTPLGAAWAIPGLAAAEDPGVWVSAGIAVATAAAAAAAWFAVVDRMLHRPERAQARERAGLGWFALTPASPAGVIAARSLVYWLGDRRYRVNIVVVPVAALLATLPLLVAGVPPAAVALVPAPLAALLLGWLPHDDLAYDSSAIWLHVASAVPGWADRVGRLVPIGLIGLPLLAVGVPLSVILAGDVSLAPALSGVCAALFLSAAGLSSISSVAWPYLVPSPGDSPFRQPQRTTATGVGAQAFVMIGALVLSAPTGWVAWLTLTADRAWGLLALVLGATTGLAVLAIGIALGAVLFDRRSDALMEFAATA